ncbi:hypothetical protein RISK_003531 [Rhodopirellula islandica]|uniref:Uncharacterized protein n=1 Tax=Rhodopirellula islandica TaxID=595434 RepID=A0A0J1BCZ6_RHOIS|nr:hypothetical protein RISK_003531 [Rhodopirellula islandica]
MRILPVAIQPLFVLHLDSPSKRICLSPSQIGCLPSEAVETDVPLAL